MSDLEILKNIFNKCDVSYYTDGCCECPLNNKIAIELGTESGECYFYFNRDNEEFIGCYNGNMKAFYPKNCDIRNLVLKSEILKEISSEFSKIGLQNSLFIRSDEDSDFEVLHLPSGLDFCDRSFEKPKSPQEKNDIVGKIVGVVTIKT